MRNIMAASIGVQQRKAIILAPNSWVGSDGKQFEYEIERPTTLSISDDGEAASCSRLLVGDILALGDWRMSTVGVRRLAPG